MSAPHISPPELKDVLSLPTEQRPVLLDVRTEQEHARVAIPGSLLIPLQELEARAEELSSFKEKDIVAYCHHGMRSQTAANFLMSKGFRVKSLTGGIDLYAHQVDPSLRRY